MKKFLKIVGIVVVAILVLGGIVIWATSGIASIARDQIYLISTGNVEGAYTKYSSKDFMQATTLDQFKGFVAAHKQLTENTDSTFSAREISTDGIGTLEGTITAKDGSIAQIKYTFVKEGEDWKILNMEFPKGIAIENQKEGTFIAGTAVSDLADKDSIVAPKDNKDSFKPETEIIYGSVYLVNPPAKKTVTGEIEYVSTGDKVGPVDFDTLEGGDQTLAFTFSKPTAGWPEGDYIFRTKLWNGEEKTQNFKVVK